MAIENERDTFSAPTELMKFETRHVPGALKLSQEMGWPYRREDWEFAAMVGQGLVLERTGEVIGTALWWNYGQAYATAGMIIVTASAQGGGNGSRLFDGLLQSPTGATCCSTRPRRGFRSTSDAASSLGTPCSSTRAR